jgi:hypothetical protein
MIKFFYIKLKYKHLTGFINIFNETFKKFLFDIHCIDVSKTHSLIKIYN